jgi:hypothetical protein
MLNLIDSFVERDLSGPDRSCPHGVPGVRVGKVRKKDLREGWFRGRVEARVSYHFAGRRVSQFANMNRFLGIWESLVDRDASNDIQRDH